MFYENHGAGTNRLLASLPSEDAVFVESISRFVYPAPGDVLAGRSCRATELWFPHYGVVALTALDASGRSVQTGLIGSEGCLGIEALFAHSPTLPDAVVQVGGPMSVVQVTQLRPALVTRPAIQTVLARFLYMLSMQSLQNVACNRLHSLLSRCCRWLLTIQDHIAGNDLPLTQENLATLLGSGRPRINSLLATLEKNSVLRRHRGRISLLERSWLETHACECYWRVRRSFITPDLTEP